MKKVAIHSLGCKVNSYEAESMEIMLRDEGYEIVPFSEDVQADIYIINTCSVTNIADRKSRQMLHKAKKMNPEAVVVAAGCYVQADPDGVKKDECVDIILGNNMKISIVEALNDYFGGSDKTSYLVDINDKYQEYESLKINQTGEHTRAYIKIQDGCNQFCSYCIIPYVRGRVRSRKPEDIVNEVKTLAATGVKEVVLTGIHISSYGTDLENISLIELIEAIHEIEGIKRIRLGSLEPRIITEEFAKRIARLEKICPHFHLSLQSVIAYYLLPPIQPFLDIFIINVFQTSYKSGSYLNSLFLQGNGIITLLSPCCHQALQQAFPFFPNHKQYYSIYNSVYFLHVRI